MENKRKYYAAVPDPVRGVDSEVLVHVCNFNKKPMGCDAQLAFGEICPERLVFHGKCIEERPGVNSLKANVCESVRRLFGNSFWG